MFLFFLLHPTFFYSHVLMYRDFCCVFLFFFIALGIYVLFFSLFLSFEEDLSVYLDCVHNCLFAFLIHHHHRCHARYLLNVYMYVSEEQQTLLSSVGGEKCLHFQYLLSSSTTYIQHNSSLLLGSWSLLNSEHSLHFTNKVSKM